MTNFTKTRLTDKGLALLAKTGVSVTVTKVKTGNGEYQTDADIGAMTELKSEKQEFQITSTQKKTDTTYAIKFVMSNKELAEDYLFTEIGIYASDPDEGEILYAVCYAENKDADMIRKYSGLYEFKAIIVLNIQVNAGGVVNVVEQGLYALAEDLEELREEVGDKVDKEEGKGLSHNDFTDVDKKKLDGIDEGANKTVIDSELSETSENPVKNSVIKKHIDDIEKTFKEEYLTKKDVLISVNIESLKEYVGKVNIADIYRPDRYILEFSREQYDDSDPLRNVLKAGTIFYVNESVSIDVATGKITSQFVFPAGYYEVRKDIYVVYDSDGNFVSSNDYGNSKNQIRDDGYLYLTLCDIDGETNKAEYMNIIPDTAYISNLVSELDSRISALEAK